MAVKKADYPLEKITLKLRKGDFKWLQHMYPDSGAAKVIREMIIERRKWAEARAEQRLSSIPDLKLNLEDVT